MKFASFCITMILVCCVIAPADTIILRDQAQPVRGSILSGGDSGLRIELLGRHQETALISWSVIVEIQSSRPYPALQTFLQQGRELYRAKQRLLRGDVVLAEPLFAKAFSRLEGSACDDSRLAAEGLLRCALSRGDLSTAVHPWLETVRLEEIGIAEPFLNLEPVLDPSTLLCPHLPLVWLQEIDLLQICRKYSNLSQPITAAIASSLIEFQSDLKPIEGVEDATFLIYILQSLNGDESSRASLLKRQGELSSWKLAWSNYFIGRSYLNEDRPDDRTIALIHFAKVASISDKLQPWLSCASMLILADEMESEGASDASVRIKNESKRLFPAHPLHKQDPFQIRSSIR